MLIDRPSVSFRYLLGAVALIASIALAGCAGDTTEQPSASQSPSSSEDASAGSTAVSSSVGDLTTSFTSEAGKFSISFPGRPDTTSQDAGTGAQKTTVEATQWVSGDNMLGVAATTFPSGTFTDANRQAMLEGSVKGAATGAGGTLDGDPQPVTIDGLTGLRATVNGVQGSDVPLEVAVVFNGDTQITFMAHPADAFDPFVSTFKLG